jgi:hypothetical protein
MNVPVVATHRDPADWGRCAPGRRATPIAAHLATVRRSAYHGGDPDAAGDAQPEESGSPLEVNFFSSIAAIITTLRPLLLTSCGRPRP